MTQTAEDPDVANALDMLERMDFGPFRKNGRFEEAWRCDGAYPRLSPLSPTEWPDMYMLTYSDNGHDTFESVRIPEEARKLHNQRLEDPHLQLQTSYKKEFAAMNAPDSAEIPDISPIGNYLLPVGAIFKIKASSLKSIKILEHAPPEEGSFMPFRLYKIRTNNGKKNREAFVTTNTLHSPNNINGVEIIHWPPEA